jgi:phage terminase large subunit-like protein
VSGDRPVWSTACLDWEQRIVEGRSLIPFEPLFPESAAAGLEVFKALRMVDAGGGLLGDLSRPWVLDFVAAIFGAYDRDTGRQLIREFLLLISKKNGKSTDAAGIMMTVLILNWRASAEFLILAPTKEIADNSFGPARDMIKADEELEDLFHIQDHIRTITHRNSGATLKIVAADSDVVGGKKAAVVLVDELWLFGKNPRAYAMLLEATGGLASRPEGFVIYLSTQSDEPPAGVFADRLEYARGVRDGTIDDPQMLPVLYEYPNAMLERKDYLKPEFFYVTNPNLGASVDEAFLLRELKKAQIGGADKVRIVLSKHWNVQIGMSLMGQRWVGADYWEACADLVMTLDEVLRRSEVITIGIDGGGLDDLLGLAVLGRCELTKNWLLWVHAWAHESVLERHKQTVTQFREFEKEGTLTICAMPGQDLEELVEIVKRVEKSELLDRLGVDQAGIGSIVEECTKKKNEGGPGIDHDRIIGIPQGWKLVGAIKTVERQLLAKKIEHSGSKLMNFAVGSARAEPRGNAVIITKQAAGNCKIDPLMATFDAVALMAMNPKPRKKKFRAFFA